MENVLKVAGVVIGVIIAISLIGWLVGFLAKAFFWVALIGGGLWLVSAIAGKSKSPLGGGR